jgi:hypothetical protein
MNRDMNRDCLRPKSFPEKAGECQVCFFPVRMFLFFSFSL